MSLCYFDYFQTVAYYSRATLNSSVSYFYLYHFYFEPIFFVSGACHLLVFVIIALYERGTDSLKHIYVNICVLRREYIMCKWKTRNFGITVIFSPKKIMSHNLLLKADPMLFFSICFICPLLLLIKVVTWCGVFKSFCGDGFHFFEFLKLSTCILMGMWKFWQWNFSGSWCWRSTSS